MNAKNKLFSIILILVLTSCNAKVSTMITKTYPTSDSNQEVFVLQYNEMTPDNTEVIGIVEVGDNGFTGNSKCTYDAVIEKAKEEALKIGGNAIKITKHKSPDGFSTCHRITADILRIENINSYILGTTLKDTIDTDYAVLNIFRNDMSWGINYDLYIGKSLLCQVPRSFKKTVLIKPNGPATIWAKTDKKDEVTIDFKPGKVYNLRCSRTSGIFIDNPTLSITESEAVSEQFAMFEPRKTETQDTIILDKEGIATRLMSISTTSAKDSLQSRDLSSNDTLVTYDKSKEKKIIISLDGGYSLRSAPISEEIPSIFIDHLKNIKNGVNVGGDISFLFNMYIGVGAKFIFFKASDEREIRTAYGYSYGEIKDKYTIPLVGPMFTLRYPLSNKKNQLLSNYSLGYMSYTNEGKFAEDSYRINGHTAYFSIDLGYDHWFSSNIGIGFKLSLINASLSKYILEDGVSKQEIKLEKDEREGLGRIDLSIGIRFGK